VPANAAQLRLLRVQGGLAGLRAQSRARLGLSKQATSAAYLQHVLRMEQVQPDP